MAVYCGLANQLNEVDIIMTELFGEQTGILIVDFQEKLCAAMDPEAVRCSERNVTHLLTLAQRLDLPVIVTEQYPKGLGPTLPSITKLADSTALAKIAFSALRDKEVATAIAESGRRQWVVVGMETHICVYQTVRDLCQHGLEVVVPMDAVLSRTPENNRVGLDLIERAGGAVSATEAVLFDLLKEANGPAFKEISRLIR